MAVALSDPLSMLSEAQGFWLADGAGAAATAAVDPNIKAPAARIAGIRPSFTQLITVLLTQGAIFHYFHRFQ
jgi:hypothetical protein